jgi:hypothetical protein
VRALIDLILRTILEPKVVISRSLSKGFSELIILQAALFVAICSTLLTYLFLQIIATNIVVGSRDSSPLLEDILSFVSSIQPIYFTANQVFQMMVFSLIITLGGRIFRGKGKFFEALLCITIVESILVLLKIVQIVLLPISAVLSFIVIVPGIVWSLWAFACMAAFIHGFKSTFLTFCGGFALSLLFLMAINAVF